MLLRDIARGKDKDILAVIDVLVQTAPDIVALQGIDYDLTNEALKALTGRLRDQGLDYPHIFAARPNTGMTTGLDMDSNGRTAEPRDAQGYGRFSGQGGMALLSRYPIDAEGVQDFSALLWEDFPGALLPETAAGPFPSPAARAAQRLSTTGHWVVPVDIPGFGTLSLLTFHASPPVFDGPEDRNGKRNHDEIIFWREYLDGALGASAPTSSFVLLGDANNDPIDGEGLKSAIRWALGDPRLQDPAPRSDGSVAASGDPFDTVDWDDPEPGNLRVDYVLPSADLDIVASGVHWPEGAAGEVAQTASRHRLVWVDLAK